MKLRQRLAWHYGSVVAVALMLLGGLMFHSYATEVRLRALLPPDRQDEARWGDTTELFVYSMIPFILVAGWWATRRSLQPLSALARKVEQMDMVALQAPLARNGNGDEVDRLTAAFNIMAGRLNRSFEQVREFTLHASHELKTPLTVMRAELETALLHAEGCSPAQKECLHSLSDEVERLTKIVDALTLLSRADAGQLALDRQPVHLAELLRESFEDAQILAEPHEVKVILQDIDDVVVLGDRHRLRQLLLVLVDNAAKYNTPGGTIWMRLRQTDAHAEIEIANTGDGIPTAMQDQVFDRFVRGDSARRQAADGCGLGLTIAQGLVRAHGGTIQLVSNPGLTRVTITLPRLLSPPASAAG